MGLARFRSYSGFCSSLRYSKDASQSPHFICSRNHAFTIRAASKPSSGRNVSSHALSCPALLASIPEAAEYVAGIVDWAPHLPQLLTHIQWSFQVPVGGATAQSPIGNLPN